MKIGFIDYVFERQAPIGTTGLSEVVWSMAQPLAEMGVEVHIAGAYELSDYPSTNINLNVHTYKVPGWWYRNVFGHALIVKRAISVLKENGPFDVIHTPEYLSTALLSKTKLHTPVVFTEPGNIYERIANGNPYDFVTTQAYKLAAYWTARSGTNVIATSDEMAYWWNYTGIDKSRIARIPLGINLKDFAPLPDARQLLDWEENKQHILFVARLSIETGLQYLLQALPAILSRFPQAHLHVLGSGSFENSLQELASNLGLLSNISWYGWLPLNELPRFYAASDLMVFPGTSGGTPRVMLQAMSCGTPFVGSAIGGITDHIESGKSGWLVPPRDVQALARATIEALENPDEAFLRAEKARNYVQGISWPAVARRIFDEVYLPLVENKSVRVPTRPSHSSLTRK